MKKRKMMNYKSIISILLIMLLFASLSGQGGSETRNFIKTVPVNKETIMEVTNKYGTIQITPWNKDSVSIRAELKATGPNQSKLTKMFDGITVNITESKFLIKAQTVFSQNMNTIFESFKGMTSKLITYESKVEINYYINVPEYINIKIDNKYGDLYMENISGKSAISLSNGSFKANTIGNGSELTLTFCDATINSIATGKINSSFSEITIGETSDLTINSISSKFEIKKAGIIDFESRRDKFFLGTIEKLQGSSYFTEYRVDNLKNEVNINARYGKINAELVDKGFQSIDITSSYTDISIDFDPLSSYTLNIRHINTFLVLPDKNVKIEKKPINEEKREYITFGTVGHITGTAKVKMDCNRGNIYLK